MHQALYRKWRPATFDEVVGQEHITDILKYETANGLFCHAYLFCGSRGTGKTTCAKILSRAVNCTRPVNGNPCGECEACRAIADGTTTDVLEMDAASNNKVDDIRNILDEVVYTPTSMKYRVYIIDEVHMLSASAFNALLKTLEEPPAHVVFILATTEMQKLPATIVSRCQRFDFRRISVPVICERLAMIAREEGVELERDAALMLARAAQGGMRDAISLFELCAAGGGKVSAEIVADCVGICGRENMSTAVRAISAKNVSALFDVVAGIDASAKDMSVFWQELISYYRDMLVVRTVGADAAGKYLDLTDAETKILREDAQAFSRETLSYHSRLLDEAASAMQRPGASKRTTAELALVRLCDERLSSAPDALLARIAALEAAVAMGNVAVRDTAPAAERADTAAEATVAPRESHEDKKPAHRDSDASRSGKRTLRPLKCWAEIMDNFRSGNPGVAALLGTERAYIDEKENVVVCYSKDITKIMVSAPEKMRAFCGSLSLVMGKPYDASKIVFEKVAAGGAPSDAEILADMLDGMAGGAE